MVDSKFTERELGKVTHVFFGREDHGILTFQVQFDFGNGYQSFGGFQLDDFCTVRGRRIGSARGTDLVLRLLDLFGVSSLEKIVGRTAYALRERHGGPITGLELPAFDGGKQLTIAAWLEEWSRP